MSEIQVRNWTNKKVRTLELDPVVFDYPYKEHLVWEAVQAYQAAGRSGTHKTKNRVDVSGGGAKPWRQKGTGRARAGDNRSPLWRHGGTVHGPQPRDYSWNFPKRMRLNALRSVLAQKHRDGKVLCLDDLAVKEPKTAALEKTLAGKLKLSAKTLLVPLETDQNLELAARNNPRLNVVRALGVSVVDLLDCDTVVISESAIKRLERGIGAMKNEFGTVRQPLITEKSTLIKEAHGTYCFKVHVDANKLEIARAVEKLFQKDKVKVASVRTASVKGKAKRMGRFVGRRPDWKKAWVKLSPDSGEIEFFEAS